MVEMDEGKSPRSGLSRVLLSGELVYSDHFEPRSILLTGGAGFIGSHVAILLARRYPQYKVRAQMSNLRVVETGVDTSELSVQAARTAVCIPHELMDVEREDGEGGTKFIVPAHKPNLSCDARASAWINRTEPLNFQVESSRLVTTNTFVVRIAC